MYTAAEIAEMGLPGLPGTKRAILTRAEKEGWPYEVRLGLGGERKVFVVPSRYLPDVEATTEASQTPAERMLAPNKGAVVGAVVAGSAQGDMDRIQLVVRAVSEWERERGVKISDDRRPAVIAVLYDYVKKAEESGEAELGIERFLKALG